MSGDAARILGLIPARGGSKGIPRKNLRELAGRPLIVYTFDATRASRCLDRVIVSTDDLEIADLARRAGIEVPFMRPAELASDAAAMLPVVEHAIRELKVLDGYQPDYIALLQPTAPLRQPRHIEEALRLLVDSGADSVVSVCRVPEAFHPCWVHEVTPDGRLVEFVAGGPERYTGRQALPPVYSREGTIYAFRRETVTAQNSLYGKHCLAYVMEPEDVLHLDSELDWSLAEMVMARRAAGVGREGA